MTKSLTVESIAQETAAGILRSLCDRKGFDSWFFDIDPEFQKEIKDFVAEHVHGAIVKARGLERRSRNDA